MMDADVTQTLLQCSEFFLRKNYDYLWLKTMLQKGQQISGTGAALITGSSHALNGIEERVWQNAVNCSMHSQDLYYDFMCARKVLDFSPECRIYSRCFIIMGYYIAFWDLSRSTGMRESMISNIYYPIFHNAHNWESPVEKDLWGGGIRPARFL